MVPEKTLMGKKLRQWATADHHPLHLRHGHDGCYVFLPMEAKSYVLQRCVATVPLGEFILLHKPELSTSKYSVMEEEKKDREG